MAAGHAELGALAKVTAPVHLAIRIRGWQTTGEGRIDRT